MIAISFRLFALGLFLPNVCPLVVQAAPAERKQAPASAPGHIDEGVLKYVAEESRLNALSRHYADLNIKMSPQEAFSFANSNEVRDLANRISAGSVTRGTFMQKAPQMIEKRRKQVEKVLADKMHDAEALEAQPQRKAELFLQLLGDAVWQLHLPLPDDKARILLGKQQQKLFDEDARRRRGGKHPPPEHDEAWLTAYVKETESALTQVLKPEHMRELIRIWPILFPAAEFETPRSK